MDRRDFFTKTGCGIAAVMLARLGLKAGGLQGTPEEQKEKIMKLLMKMGKSKDDIAAMMKEMEEMLPMVEDKCICKTCPTYVSEEKVLGFCHTLVSKSAVIKTEKGCSCPQCPVYKTKEMKNGYYCTRMSELEQEAAKKA